MTDEKAEQSASTPSENNGEFEQITLDTPIARGNKNVSTLTLRKPRAGELRGVNLADLLQMDVAAIARVLPRISDPVLAEKEINALDPADLVQIGSAVAGFLLTKQAKASNAG